LPPGGSLVISGLTVERAGRVVVDGLSAAVRPGSITALIGPNGAGKSSVLKAILGLIPSRNGTVTLDGQDVLAMERRRRARAIGYVPQRSLMSASMSVINLVATGRFAHHGALARLSRTDRDAIEHALGQVDASALAERRFDELSGGECQRVLLARALATGSRTILLDEPTAGLDIGHALSALRLMRQLADQGCTLLVVLHHFDEVRRISDQAVLMHQGRVLAQGPVPEVLAPGPLHQAFGVETDPDAPGTFRLSTGTP
jgi:iron complex transport system ATP-binding protein